VSPATSRHVFRRIAGGLLAAAVGGTVLAGCTAGTVPSATLSPAASPSVDSSTPVAVATESNPPGDIPDNQVYVDFQVPGTSVHVKVPEGWSQSGSGQDASFTDKLNSVEIAVSAAGSVPTVASVTSADVPSLTSAVSNFALGDVTAVTRKGGDAVLLTYEADSAPDSVTNKVVRDAIERYTFYSKGTRVDLTLTGPKGADNVDPWRIVSDSVTL